MRQRIPTITATLLLLLAGPGCKGIQDLISTAPGEGVSLTAAATSLPADGVAQVTVSATIPPATMAGERSITFTTTGGKFIGATGADARTLVLEADLEGRAAAVLQAGTSPGVVVIGIATATGVVRTSSLEFTFAAPERLLLATSVSRLSAAGASNATLTAQLVRSQGQVSAGLFVEFAATGVNGQSVGRFTANPLKADNDGKAVTTFDAAGATYRGMVRVTANVQNPPAGSVPEGVVVIELTN